MVEGESFPPRPFRHFSCAKINTVLIFQQMDHHLFVASLWSTEIALARPSSRLASLRPQTSALLLGSKITKQSVCKSRGTSVKPGVCSTLKCSDKSHAARPNQRSGLQHGHSGARWDRAGQRRSFHGRPRPPALADGCFAPPPPGRIPAKCATSQRPKVMNQPFSIPKQRPSSAVRLQRQS